MTDDIVTRLREHWENEKMLGNDWLCEVLRDASDEIKRLRQERVDWFCVAQQLKNATFQDSMMVELARDHYLRVRGRYEDPRDCM